jgi:hypothetical protein
LGTTTSTTCAGPCGCDELACLTSYDPPVYQCLPAGLGCDASIPEPDAGGIVDASPVQVSDGAVCSPGEVACPYVSNSCRATDTTFCSPAGECLLPPCFAPYVLPDGAACGLGASVCYDACSGAGTCLVGAQCPEQAPCR